MDSFKLASGADYPQLGLGTWQGNGEVIKNAVTEALKLGYRHVDSAWVYYNESDLGEAFKECFDRGILTRQELFYTSKLPQYAHRRDRVKEYLQLTLKMLDFEYVDLYLIHFPVSCQYSENCRNWLLEGGEDDVPLDEEQDLMNTWRGMEDCVDAGMAKHIGLSNFNAKQIQCIYDGARIKPSNLQVECHIYLQQRPLLELCRKLGMTLTAYSPLGSPGAPSFLKERFGQDFKLAASILEEPILQSLAEKYHKTAAQVALRFLVQLGMVVIPKSVSLARIKENSQIFDFHLADEDMNALGTLDQGLRLFHFDGAKGMTTSKKYPW